MSEVDYCKLRILAAARRLVRFTASDVEHEPLLQPNNMGAAFRALKREGKIRGTGEFVMTTKEPGKGRVVQVWEYIGD